MRRLPMHIPNPSQGLILAYVMPTPMHMELGLNEDLIYVPAREPDEDPCYEVRRSRAFNLAEQEFTGFDTVMYQDW